MAVLGTFVDSNAEEITFEMAMNDSVDSLPPFRIAALPDFMASEAMLAITSGRASKMMRSTPMGHETLSRVSPSSNFVRNVIFPTITYNQYNSSPRPNLSSSHIKY